MAFLIGVPAAQIDLCKAGDRFGVLSPAFINPKGLFPGSRKSRAYEEFSSSSLYHGNQVLKGSLRDYDKNAKKQKSHTIENIIQSIKALSREEDVWKGILEYFIFDCWIGNTDRHHENWGLIQYPNGQYRLAPSYDHGAALDPLSSKEKKTARINKGDSEIRRFYERGRSAINGPDERLTEEDREFSVLYLLHSRKRLIEIANTVSDMESG